MKEIVIPFLCSYLICGCGLNKDKSDTLSCEKFNVSVAKYDTINYETDLEYGIGDDDIFSASDLIVYKRSPSGNVDISDKVNDYNLTTAYKGLWKKSGADTFDLLIDFKGLYSDRKIDTTVVITNMDIVNGDRNSLNDWQNMGMVKRVKILHNNRLIGCATLQKTHKIQTITMDKTPIVNRSGKIDTISIIVDSIYEGSGGGKKYAISEIKLNGVKNY